MHILICEKRRGSAEYDLTDIAKYFWSYVADTDASLHRCIRKKIKADR